jgi:hypothetical protein
VVVVVDGLAVVVVRPTKTVVAVVRWLTQLFP